MDKPKYMSLEQLLECGQYPFTKGQLRCFLLARNENGLNKAVRRVGKRLLIRPNLFDDWIESYEVKNL